MTRPARRFRPVPKHPDDSNNRPLRLGHPSHASQSAAIRRIRPRAMAVSRAPRHPPALPSARPRRQSARRTPVTRHRSSPALRARRRVPIQAPAIRVGRPRSQAGDASRGDARPSVSGTRAPRGRPCSLAVSGAARRPAVPLGSRPCSGAVDCAAIRSTRHRKPIARNPSIPQQIIDSQRPFRLLDVLQNVK